MLRDNGAGGMTQWDPWVRLTRRRTSRWRGSTCRPRPAAPRWYSAAVGSWCSSIRGLPAGERTAALAHDRGGAGGVKAGDDAALEQRQQVTVMVHGHAERGVAEPFADHLGVSALDGQQRSVCVAQVVEPAVGVDADDGLGAPQVATAPAVAAQQVALG